MAYWAAIGQAAGGVASAWMAQDSQRAANKTNVKLQQNQQAWEEKMSNTAVQRRMQDLQAAGINPLLAGGAGGEATTPNVAPARVDPTFSSSSAQGVQQAAGSLSQLVMLKAASAQAEKSAADARLTNAQAAITEKDIPWSAQNAMSKSATLAAESERAAGLARSALAQGAVDLSNMEVKQRTSSAVMELQEAYQSLVNQGAKLGLSEAEATADFWKTVGASGKGGPVAVQALKVLLESLSMGQRLFTGPRP